MHFWHIIFHSLSTATTRFPKDSVFFWLTAPALGDKHIWKAMAAQCWQADSTITTGNFSIANDSYRVNNGKISLPPIPTAKWTMLHCPCLPIHLPVFFLEVSVHRRAQASALLAFLLANKPASDPLNESLLTIIYSQDKEQEQGGVYMYSVNC